jgi:hypothetical protein
MGFRKIYTQLSTPDHGNRAFHGLLQLSDFAVIDFGRDSF